MARPYVAEGFCSFAFRPEGRINFLVLFCGRGRAKGPACWSPVTPVRRLFIFCGLCLSLLISSHTTRYLWQNYKKTIFCAVDVLYINRDSILSKILPPFYQWSARKHPAWDFGDIFPTWCRAPSPGEFLKPTQAILSPVQNLQDIFFHTLRLRLLPNCLPCSPLSGWNFPVDVSLSCRAGFFSFRSQLGSWGKGLLPEHPSSTAPSWGNLEPHIVFHSKHLWVLGSSFFGSSVGSI